MSWKNILLISLLFTCSLVHAETKKDFEVFKKWMEVQHVFKDRDINTAQNYLNDAFVEDFQGAYEEKFVLLNRLVPFLKDVTGGYISPAGYQIKVPLPKSMKESFASIYSMLDNNIPGFIDYLKETDFSRPDIDREERALHYDFTIEKYKAFTRLLFAVPDQLEQDEYLFAVANRLFEYSFSDQTFGHYQELLLNQEYYPITRFLHATCWYRLVGDGWKHWHQNCLDAIKKRSEQGHEIVYFAGGTDIYQLLKHGIYNITVIDPFLPSQERFYTENWQWLLRGNGNAPGIEDKITCIFDGVVITLERSSFTQGETFLVKLSTGQVAELKKSITRWTVRHDKTKEILGTITFDRRNVTQDDFVEGQNKVLLMSYDEMIYASIPDMLDGWGIDPSKISPELQIIVKQLRKPVDKKIMSNIRIASLINLSDVRFINFASDPN